MKPYTTRGNMQCFLCKKMVPAKYKGFTPDGKNFLCVECAKPEETTKNKVK